MTIGELINKVGFKVKDDDVKNVNNTFQSIKNTATKLLGTIGIGLSVAGISSFIKDSVALASEVEEMENKFNVVFQGINEEVDAWAQNYADAIGRNKNDIKTYLADQENLLVGFGMTREAGAELAEQMTSLTEAASETNADPSIGWEVEFFLNGAINIDDYVKLESKNVTGFFRVAKLRIQGDNLVGDWMCSAKLMELAG